MSSPFLTRLAGSNPASEADFDPASRRWLFVAYDQLSDQIGPLAEEDPGDLGIVLVETSWKPRLRPYHVQKLATLLTSQRHFALEQAERGVAVHYLFSEEPYSEALRTARAELGLDERGEPLRMQEAAEWELRRVLEPLVEDGHVEVVPHGAWLTTTQQFCEHAGEEPPWRMDRFYRGVRQDTGLLMDGDSPEGGRYSFDGDNREAWSGEPEAPDTPTFEVDEITAEVGALIEERFADHPGALRLEAIAASRDDVERLWQWALERCMEHFGAYEDAMSSRSSGIFHTRISPLLNLCRLLPERVVHDVAQADIPLNSKEGFIRQVIGWREFVRHVHRETDGLRRLPGKRSGQSGRNEKSEQIDWREVPALDAPGDGGHARWQEWLEDRDSQADDGGEDAADVTPVDARWPLDADAAQESSEAESDLLVQLGGAAPSELGSDGELPPAFWGAPSGLRCLDTVVEDVWREGYSHHITRLMVLGNLATLLDLSPRQLTDWFWVAYADAYDWVVEPNVLGMATFAAGELMTTKPYVSGAAYIHRMSDYCGDCAFHPKKTCPITRWYWAFLERHAEALEGNQRIAMQLRSAQKRSDPEQELDAAYFETARELLEGGELLTPEVFAELDERLGGD